MGIKEKAFASALLLLLLSGCNAQNIDNGRDSADEIAETSQADLGHMDSADVSALEDSGNSIDSGTQEYRGFMVDSVLHSVDVGDIHFSIHVPDSYDPSTSASLFMTLPGYQGLYFQGVGQNLYTEDFAFEATRYDDNMIVIAPQLNDWGFISAEQAVALIRAIIDEYAIDEDRIFIEGYSGGGETLSLVLEMAPELFAAAGHFSSQWDGDLTALAATRTPVYFAIGEGDEYYGPGSAMNSATELRRLYKEQGLSDGEIDELVVFDMKPASYFLNAGATNQHGGGAELFAHDNAIMGWIFSR